MGSVRFIITGKAKDGQAEAFAELANRMFASVSANEPDTTTYSWYIADDGSFVNEDEYASSDALGVHLGNAQDNGTLSEYVALSDITAVHVLGEVDSAARDMLEAFGAVHYNKTHGL
jgi:quinol monooxygenase YgiN